MKINFINKKHETDSVWSFCFEKPENITWVAGQYQTYYLPVESENKDDKRHFFTISSAPHEGYFQITTRLTGSKFKTALDNLKIGDPIDCENIEGDFVWVESKEPKVFIAGGIGVTPFRSMLADRRHKGLSSDVHLIYANRDDNVVFRPELDELSKSDPSFKVTYLTGQQLTPELLLKTDEDLLKKLVYLSGPEPMVDDLGQKLLDAGLPKNQLKQDWFPGYAANSYFQN